MVREQLILVEAQRRKPPMRVHELVRLGLVLPAKPPEPVKVPVKRRRRRMQQTTIYDRLGILGAPRGQ
jgi:hypothetical protein